MSGDGDVRVDVGADEEAAAEAPAPRVGQLANFRLVLLGAQGVGKTSLCRRLVASTFTFEHNVTTETELFARLVTIEDLRFMLQVEDTPGVFSEASIKAAVNSAAPAFTEEFVRSMQRKSEAKARDDYNKWRATLGKPRRGEHKPLLSEPQVPLYDTYTEAKARHAYLVVFDATNSLTLQVARDILRVVAARQRYDAAIDARSGADAQGMITPVFLVATKVDKDRQVLEVEGRSAASAYGAKYLEVSSRTDSNVRYLFDKVIAEIRHRYNFRPAVHTLCCGLCWSKRDKCNCCRPMFGTALRRQWQHLLPRKASSDGHEAVPQDDADDYFSYDLERLKAPEPDDDESAPRRRRCTLL